MICWSQFRSLRDQKPFIYQHDVDEAPDYARAVALEVEEGHVVDYLVCDNLATLLYVTNLGAIERHPWNSRARNPDRPDWVVFDLDPGEGVEFAAICEVALRLKDVIGRADLECFAKTSGSRGIHVYVPLKPVHGYEEVADFAERVASIVASDLPRLATVERSLKKRPRGSVYVDHLQNARTNRWSRLTRRVRVRGRPFRRRWNGQRSSGERSPRRTSRLKICGKESKERVTSSSPC